jgi:hypothetical protein
VVLLDELDELEIGLRAGRVHNRTSSMSRKKAKPIHKMSTPETIKYLFHPKIVKQLKKILKQNDGKVIPHQQSDDQPANTA